MTRPRRAAVDKASPRRRESPPGRFELTARRVGGEDGELRDDENGVLATVDELLAKRVRAERALGGAVVAMKMDERGDAFFGAEAIPLGDEDDHGVVAVPNPGERCLGEPEHERRAEGVAGERLEPSPSFTGSARATEATETNGSVASAARNERRCIVPLGMPQPTNGGQVSRQSDLPRSSAVTQLRRRSRRRSLARQRSWWTA